MPHTTNTHSIKNEIKDTFSLSIPLVAAQLIYACSGFIGTAMVARLGKDALAASILVSMIWVSLSVLFFGVLNSISILVSHQYGAKNNKAISEIMGQSYLLGIVICVLIILVLLSMPLFLRFSAQPPAVLELAREYMRAQLWMMPGLVILVINEQFLTGINRAKLVLRISILVVPIETFLIYLFIFGKFGLPACGIKGVSYGFAVTYTSTAIVLSWYLLKSKYYRPFQIFAVLRKIDMHWLTEIIRIGLPMGFMHVIEITAFTIATFWIGQFGTTMLAAHQIVMQYLWLAITVVFAMSQAVTVRVGHAVGRNDLSGIHYAVYVGVTLNFVFMLFITAAFYFYPQLFLKLDIDIYNPKNALLVQDAAALLSICGILMLFDNFRIILFGALRGIKDTHFPMYASLIGFWVIGLSTAYLLSFVLGLQGKGIWWGLTIGIASGALMVVIRLQKQLKNINFDQLMQIEKSR